jgi:hypothetical protein
MTKSKYVGKPWTEDRVQEILDLLHQGKSLNVIADIVGMTRKAVSDGMRRHGYTLDLVWRIEYNEPEQKTRGPNNRRPHY